MAVIEEMQARYGRNSGASFQEAYDNSMSCVSCLKKVAEGNPETARVALGAVIFGIFEMASSKGIDLEPEWQKAMRQRIVGWKKQAVDYCLKPEQRPQPKEMIDTLENELKGVQEDGCAAECLADALISASFIARAYDTNVAALMEAGYSRKPRQAS